MNFLKADVFRFPGNTEVQKDNIRRQLSHSIMAFDTGMAPIVGRQLTLQEQPSPAENEMLGRLMARAEAGDTDLIARGWDGNLFRGWLYRDGNFKPDQSSKAPLSIENLITYYRNLREPLTFTCVPPGDGLRSALDRDLDGYLNAD